ncbi:MAG: MarR family transcriptional regulator [Ilumatobacteraceae bacterium]|nr:MarR family transcriptional regulator [Ilumatobacteraceae bacterium]MCU1389735.1 MarR family transcriptional regulator [Ilumatobacteraceae bacterium]
MKAPATKPTIITRTQVAAWFALLFTHASLTSRLDAVLQAEHSISFSEFEIMCRLKDHEAQPVRALAAQLVSVSPTRASRLVQELVDAGHLQRGADQGDGRISLISFTTAGRRYAEIVSRTFEHAVKTHFVDRLDSDDIAALIKIWTKLEPDST